MSDFKLTIEETSSRHFMEREKRYDVKVNGTKVDELYYNMTGYRGALMTIHGSRLDIGEKGISAWKKEAAALNREARAFIATFNDPRRLVSSDFTSDGNLRKLTFADPDDLADRTTIYASNTRFMAGVELFGMQGVDIGFFDPLDAVPDLVPGELLRSGEAWGSQRIALGIFATSDPAWTALAVGHLPTIAGKIISGDVPNKQLPDNWGIEDLGQQMSLEFAENFQQVVYIPTDIVCDLVSANCSDVLRSEILPGKGAMSHKDFIFAPMITSSGDRPEILLTQVQEQIFSEGLRRQGHRFAIVDVEASHDEMPSP